jgi:epoxyqueuosine reductase
LESNTAQFKELLKAEAANLGFPLFGVTTPNPPTHLEVFKNWLARGFHGEMAYLERHDTVQKRSDPSSLLSGCKSLIMFGVPYPVPAFSPSKDIEYDVASYAHLEDYHDWIPEKLKKISLLISEMTGGKAKILICTDSAPILERDLAWRAGLGWIGRNGCLISRAWGTYFLIAEILTDLELPPDEPLQQDYCGICNRCVKACPTGCIQPDRTLDAQRCITYLTIENKHEIPVDLRSSVGNHIFGCDICQSVCPWNNKRQSIFDVAPRAKLATHLPTLNQILSLDKNEFQRNFQNSPIYRAKRSGLLRNAAIVMGNQQSPENIQFLEKTLAEEKDEFVRSHLLWAISQSRCV